MAFGLLTVLQVVLGELVPKSLSLASAERVALLVARPFHWFLNTFSWAIDSLDGVAERIARISASSLRTAIPWSARPRNCRSWSSRRTTAA